MGLSVNGKPLRRMTYNGLEITQDAGQIKSIDFRNFDNGSFIVTDISNVAHTYNVEFDGDGNPIRFYDNISSITITW